MPSTDPFGLPGRFWRGNLHTHTTASDGTLTASQVSAVYREAGYDFLALTDHFLELYDFPLTEVPLADERFVGIRAAELHAGKMANGELWHMVAVGLPQGFAPPPPHEDGPSLARRAADAGAFVAAAHPAWNGTTADDIRSLGRIHAVETWNATAHVQNDKADSWYVLDQLLASGARLNACVADDAHFDPARPGDARRGWVWVKSERLDGDAVLDALKRGAYYSSTGPQIHDLRVVGRQLHIRCSQVEWMFVTGSGSQGLHRTGRDLVEAAFDLSRLKGPYLRVTIRDAQGGRAWSNPVWL